MKLEFKDRLKKWRAGTGMTQAMAALVCCASESAYAHWEEGERRPLPIIEKLLVKFVIGPEPEGNA